MTMQTALHRTYHRLSIPEIIFLGITITSVILYGFLQLVRRNSSGKTSAQREIGGKSSTRDVEKQKPQRKPGGTVKLHQSHQSNQMLNIVCIA